MLEDFPLNSIDTARLEGRFICEISDLFMNFTCQWIFYRYFIQMEISKRTYVFIVMSSNQGNVSSSMFLRRHSRRLSRKEVSLFYCNKFISRFSIDYLNHIELNSHLPSFVFSLIFLGIFIDLALLDISRW